MTRRPPGAGELRGSPAPRPFPAGSVASRALVVLLVGLPLALSRPYVARAADPDRLYLPRLERGVADGPPEACALVEAAWPCAANGWALSCGGMGSIRELISLQDEDATVLAVGDGVARFRLVNGRPSWTAQAGGPLTGLGSAALLLSPDRAGVRAWAAGSAGRLALETGGCWKAAASRNPDLDLKAIRALAPGILPGYFGWAVGSRCQAGADCRAAILHLDHPDDPLAWVDWGLTELPPLEDVALRRSLAPPGESPVETWMVGGPAGAAAQARRPAQEDPACRPGDWGAGLFLRSAPNAASSLLPLACFAQGRPQELTLTSGGGLALGRSAAGEDLLAWLVEPRTAELQVLPEPLARGRSLADLYYANLDRSRSGQGDLPRLWMALHPAAETSMLWELGLTPGEVPRLEPLGLPEALRRLPAPVAPRDAALAPLLRDPGEGAEQLDLEGLLLAWGDGVWLRDQDSGSWLAARRRLALQALALVPGQRGLILAEEAGRQLLFAQEGEALRQVHAYDGLLAGRPRARALLGQADSPWPYWLAGDGGLLWGLDGRGAAQAFPLPPAVGPATPDLAALADAGAGDLWVLTQAPDGGAGSGIWRARPALGRWDLLAEAGPLSTLAAGQDGELWAAGPGGVLWSAPGCPTWPPPQRWRCDCTDLAGQARLLCRLDRTDLRHLAPAGPAQAWASSGRGLLLLSPQDPRGRSWRFAAGAGPLQAGEEIRRLLSTPAGDLWLLSRCGRDIWLGEGPGRGVGCSAQAPFWGRASRYRPGVPDLAAGTWEPSAELRLNVEPLALALAPDPSGAPALWLSGDWSTLAHRPLAEEP